MPTLGSPCSTPGSPTGFLRLPEQQTHPSQQALPHPPSCYPATPKGGGEGGRERQILREIKREAQDPGKNKEKGRKEEMRENEGREEEERDPK